MKKYISIICLMLFTLGVSAQQFSATVVKRGNAPVDTVVTYFNPKFVQYITCPSDSTAYIAYKNVLDGGRTVLFKTTDVSNDVAFNANVYYPNLIPVNVVTKINNTTRDTAIRYYFPVDKLSDVKSATVIALPKANASLYRDENGKFNKHFIKETASAINARIDSIAAQMYDVSTTSYDTSTHVMKTYEKHIVLGGATADTLTLLNPNQFANRGVLTIVNKGSGTFTINGGFTVKDRSGSNITTLAGGAALFLKAYKEGTSYIWIKEN